MQEYKLIKCYPNSPKLGAIADNSTGYWRYKKNSIFTNMTHKPENHPEFWEEVIDMTELLEEAKRRYPKDTEFKNAAGEHTLFKVAGDNIKEYTMGSKYYKFAIHETNTLGLLYTDKHGWAEIIEKPVEKDYEILSIASKSDGEIYKDIDSIHSYENGSTKYYNIHSVKRLSDGEILTITDPIEDGNIGKFKIHGHQMTFSNSNHMSNYFRPIRVINKLIKKDYEILSFVHDGSLSISKGYIVCMKDGKLYSGTQLLTEDHYLDSKCWSVNSIKRLSDGEVFTLGDMITTSNFTDPRKIVKIRDNDEYMIEQTGGISKLENIKKRCKLFTTEDKVDIFEEDKCWYVNSFRLDCSKPEVWNGNVTNIERGRAYFSTKNAAEAWIDKHKPKVILTSEDGVKMYKGDRYWWVSDKLDFNNIKPYNIHNYESCRIPSKSAFQANTHVFSSEKAAQEYIDSKRVKVEDGYLYEGEKAYYSMLNSFSKGCMYFSTVKTVVDFNDAYTFFTTEKARDKYIEENKPMYSKKDMLDFKKFFTNDSSKYVNTHFHNWKKSK